jgi:glycosyltransferase involved in cell wall biosynthesis
MKNKINSVVFLSNYFNHHQQPLSDAIYSKIGDGYKFIETEMMDEERINMGWGLESVPRYVVSADDYSEKKDSYQKLIDEADVVVIGSAPNKLVKNRIKSNKLVFRYAERPLKKGLEIKKYIPRLIKWHLEYPNRKLIYMLCASAYTSGDYAKFGLFKNRCYKWGYFTPLQKYEDIKKIIDSKNPAAVLWVARLIDWKHPEIPIKIAKRLKSDGYKFELNMIGNGELFDEINALVLKENLNDCVHLLGAMKPTEVRKYMEESEIFMFTSDRNEGWGAVLNEAMNSACAVVASNEIGSVPFLIDDGKNGYAYNGIDVDELYDKVKFLLDNPDVRKDFGEKAYETILNEWNGENAAEKLLLFAKNIINGDKTDIFESGVCSISK